MEKKCPLFENAARQSDLPMHSPISQFRKILPKISENSAISFAQPCIIPSNAQNKVDSSNFNKLMGVIDAGVNKTKEILVQEDVANDPLEMANQDQTEAVKRKMKRKPLLLVRSYNN